MPPDLDFSGNYLFVAERLRMHRLDESLRPLLEARGGRIVSPPPRPTAGTC